MMQYSFIVHSPDQLILHEVGLAFVPGRNVFTTFTSDLVALLALFDAEGVQVLELNQIGDPPPTSNDHLLEGSETAVLSEHARRHGP